MLSVSAASETESPRRNVSKAVRRVFYRILIFYVSSSSATLATCISKIFVQLLGTLVTGMKA